MRAVTAVERECLEEVCAARLAWYGPTVWQDYSVYREAVLAEAYQLQVPGIRISGARPFQKGDTMRWQGIGMMVVAGALVGLPGVTWAQHPHFTACVASTTGGALTVAGQVAGLGNQMKPVPVSLHLEATATAVCVDPTTTPPSVLGFVGVADGVTYPAKNGNRVFQFVVDEPVMLPCVPPAEVVFVAVEVCDTTHAICTPCGPVPEPEPEPEPE